MKTLVLVPILSLFMLQPSRAQTDTLAKSPGYQAWITTCNPKLELSGELYEIKDSSILISHYNDFSITPRGIFDVSKIDVRKIDGIKVRKKGNVGQGILIGALSGLVVGGTLDLIVYSSWEKSNKSSNSVDRLLTNLFVETPQFIAVIAGSIGILGMGIGVGAAIGSAKITIPIRGSQEVFNDHKAMLNAYSMKHIEGLNSKSFSKLRDTVVDIDGNVYRTLALGAQVWMAENLKVTRYRDGSGIPGVTNNASVPGNLYNWGAVSDSRKLCPAGWHVPTHAEWTSLYNSLGGEDGAAHKMEERFSVTGKTGQWWSSREQDAGYSESFYLDGKTSLVMFTGAAKSSGLSVRCMRDY